MSEDFRKLIEDDRETRKKSSWKGTTMEYLEVVRENPAFHKLAHKRLYDMINDRGMVEVDLEQNPRMKRIFKGEKLKVFNFFSDEFFGMEKTINQIVRYFHSASLKGEESRQVLYLVGPVGSGKSSLVDRLKKGLEYLPPIHAIENCPMFEEPLHLVPRHLRKEFSKMLGVEIEGDL
jgi:serine protein kinase